MKKLVQIICLINCFLIIGVTGIYAQGKSPEKAFKNVSLRIIHSKILNEDRRLFVYVPKGSESLKYPVFYLLDGSRSFTFKNALQNTKNNPHIIIGIDTSKNNRRNMIPCKGSGKAKKLLRFIVQELQPYVNKHYSTIGKNIISGCSIAGLFTIYAMLTEPEAFSGYIAGSPAIGLCSNLLKEKINKFSINSKIKGKFLFIGYGDRERFKPTIDFIPSYSQLLKSRFKDILKIRIQKLPGRHCPSDFMKNGFRFIYNE